MCSVCVHSEFSVCFQRVAQTLYQMVKSEYWIKKKPTTATSKRTHVGRRKEKEEEKKFGRCQCFDERALHFYAAMQLS